MVAESHELAEQPPLEVVRIPSAGASAVQRVFLHVEKIVDLFAPAVEPERFTGLFEMGI